MQLIESQKSSKKEIFKRDYTKSSVDYSNFFQFTGRDLFPDDREAQETIGNCLKELAQFPSIAAKVLNEPEIKKDMDYFAKIFPSHDPNQRKSDGK